MGMLLFALLLFTPGLEWRNKDLRANYNIQGSWDLNDDDPDPTPNSLKGIVQWSK